MYAFLLVRSGERIRNHRLHPTAYATDHRWASGLLEDPVVPDCAAERVE